MMELEPGETAAAAATAAPPLRADLAGRIDSLIAAMSLEEKLGQLSMGTAEGAVTGPFVTAAYLAEVRAGRLGSLLNLWGAERVEEVQRVALEETRLGIPLLFGFDVLHGHRTIGPIPLAEAGAFDPGLWERTARQAALEAAADGIDLTFAPMLDIGRDPRWGRIAESAGEDPWLASRYAEAKVRGFQGASLSHPGSIAATAKHFVGYGAVAAGREYASADISERSLREVHLPPFRAAVQAGAAAVMPAFIDLAGIPMTAHAGLLRDELRGRWGFDGVLISDYNAIAELVAHGVAPGLPEAAALALRAGIDIDMMGGAYLRGLPVALEDGQVRIEEIDAAVRRVLALKVRLGLFDEPHARTRRARPRAGAASRAMAREMAARSIVLLKNAGGILPLPSGPSRIAVLGPFADARGEMLGPWAAAGESAQAVTFQEGLRSALPRAQISFAEGVKPDGHETEGIPAAVSLACESDIVILCVGEPAWMSGEGGSRAALDLPGAQRELCEAVLATGKPVIVLLTGGRPLTISWLAARADAVLATWFLGLEAGNAVADVLTGRHNPSGRLAVTWPEQLGQVPVFYGQRPTGRPALPGARYTSRYIDAPVEPLFPFGHGLSYTRFALSRLQVVPQPLRPGEPLVVELDLTNAGDRSGEATAFVFLHVLSPGVARPMRELKGVAKARLEAGETRALRITIPANEVRHLDANLASVWDATALTVHAGLSADPRDLLVQEVELPPSPGPT